MGKKKKYVLIRRTKIGQTTQRFSTEARAREVALKWIQYREGIEGGVLSMTSTAQVLPIGEYNRQAKALRDRGRRIDEARKLRMKAERTGKVQIGRGTGYLFKEKKMACGCPSGKHQPWCPFYKPTKEEAARVQRAEQNWERSLGIR